MSFWVYGNPAPPILFAYVGDSAKIRLIHGGVKETHVFYHHQPAGELHFGTQAVIRRKNGTAFRGLTLFVHDLAYVFDRKGNALNPPAGRSQHWQ